VHELRKYERVQLALTVWGRTFLSAHAEQGSATVLVRWVHMHELRKHERMQLEGTCGADALVRQFSIT